jgi:hypothetical protein
MDSLRQELQKLTSFRLPEEVRSTAARAVSSLQAKDYSPPISSTDSPVVRLILLVLSNPRLSKSYSCLVSRVLPSMPDFALEPTRLIVKRLATIALDLDIEATMKLLEYSGAGFGAHFPDLSLIQSFASIVLSLMSHKNIVISSSAVAVFPQLMKGIVSRMETVDRQSIGYTSFLNECKEKFAQFEEPLNYVLNLVFNDLSSIAAKVPLTWLEISRPPVDVIYDILELMIDAHADFLKRNQALMMIFQGAVIQGMADQNALQFVIAFMDLFLENQGSLCCAIFADYLSRITATSRVIYIPLFFFRSIAVRAVDFAFRVYSLCDSAGALFVSLIESISAFCDPNAPSIPIEFSLVRSEHRALLSDKGQNLFILSSPYEICFGIVRSFAQSKDSSITNFFKQTSSKLLKLVIFALRYSSISSFSIPCTALKTLLLSLHGLECGAEFADCFRAACELSLDMDLSNAELATFEIYEKTADYSRFLIHLAGTDPALFLGNWGLFLTRLFAVPVAPPEHFSRNFDAAILTDLIEQMLSIRPLFPAFASRVVSANRMRFALTWPLFRAYFRGALDSSAMDASVLAVFLELIASALTPETEQPILEMGVRFVAPGSNLSLQSKGMVLLQIRHLIAESVSVIKDGWSSLFQIFSPVNYDDDHAILQTSFGVLTLICNDCFTCVAQNSLPSCIEIIFRFAASHADINMSLSAFDLLWIAVRVIEHSSENWTALMKELLELIHDTRSDVSQCATRTFFSLMSSHFEQIPPEVFDFLIDSGFPNLLNQFSNASRFPDLELTLQELAHYTATFWEFFSTRQSFQTKYLPLLVKKENWLILTCTNYELVTRAFQFYECFFMCPHLSLEMEKLLRESIFVIHDHFLTITDQSCIIFACFGRLMSRVIQSLKFRNCVETVTDFFPMIRKMVPILRSITFIHLTPLKTLEGFTLLCPLPEETLFAVVSLLMELAVIEGQPCLCEYVGVLLTSIYDTAFPEALRGRFIIACASYFRFPCSEPFAQKVLDAPVPIESALADPLFSALAIIGITCPTLEAVVTSQMIELFDKTNKENQIEFVSRNQEKFEVLELLWERFFTPSSPKFSQAVYENCFNAALGGIAALLARPQRMEQVIVFLRNSRAPQREVGGVGIDRWFILRLMPVLVSLIHNALPAVRAGVEALIGSVAAIIADVVV